MDYSILLKTVTEIDWTTISNIAVTVSSVVVVVSAFFVIVQIIEMRRATHAQSYSVAREILQDENLQLARKSVFKLGKKGKQIDKWSKKEIEQAEMVCHTYDSVAQMVRHKLLRRKIIIESWGASIVKSWEILKPLVLKYRDNWNEPERWDDFEWLAKTTSKHRKKICPINSKFKLKSF